MKPTLPHSNIKSRQKGETKSAKLQQQKIKEYNEALVLQYEESMPESNAKTQTLQILRELINSTDSTRQIINYDYIYDLHLYNSLPEEQKTLQLKKILEAEKFYSERVEALDDIDTTTAANALKRQYHINRLAYNNMSEAEKEKHRISKAENDDEPALSEFFKYAKDGGIVQEQLTTISGGNYKDTEVFNNRAKSPFEAAIEFQAKSTQLYEFDSRLLNAAKGYTSNQDFFTKEVYDKCQRRYQSELNLMNKNSGLLNRIGDVRNEITEAVQQDERNNIKQLTVVPEKYTLAARRAEAKKAADQEKIQEQNLPKDQEISTEDRETEGIFSKLEEYERSLNTMSTQSPSNEQATISAKASNNHKKVSDNKKSKGSDAKLKKIQTTKEVTNKENYTSESQQQTIKEYNEALVLQYENSMPESNAKTQTLQILRELIKGTDDTVKIDDKGQIEGRVQIINVPRKIINYDYIYDLHLYNSLPEEQQTPQLKKILEAEKFDSERIDASDYIDTKIAANSLKRQYHINRLAYNNMSETEREKHHMSKVEKGEQDLSKYFKYAKDGGIVQEQLTTISGGNYKDTEVFNNRAKSPFEAAIEFQAKSTQLYEFDPKILNAAKGYASNQDFFTKEVYDKYQKRYRSELKLLNEDPEVLNMIRDTRTEVTKTVQQDERNNIKQLTVVPEKYTLAARRAEAKKAADQEKIQEQNLPKDPEISTEDREIAEMMRQLEKDEKSIDTISAQSPSNERAAIPAEAGYNQEEVSNNKESIRDTVYHSANIRIGRRRETESPKISQDIEDQEKSLQQNQENEISKEASDNQKSIDIVTESSKISHDIDDQEKSLQQNKENAIIDDQDLTVLDFDDSNAQLSEEWLKKNVAQLKEELDREQIQENADKLAQLNKELESLKAIDENAEDRKQDIKQESDSDDLNPPVDKKWFENVKQFDKYLDTLAQFNQLDKELESLKTIEEKVEDQKQESDSIHESQNQNTEVTEENKTKADIKSTNNQPLDMSRKEVLNSQEPKVLTQSDLEEQALKISSYNKVTSEGNKTTITEMTAKPQEISKDKYPPQVKDGIAKLQQTVEKAQSKMSIAIDQAKKQAKTFIRNGKNGI